MNAEEARRETIKYKVFISNEELNSIRSDITVAIYRGNFRIIREGQVSDEHRDILISEGYKVNIRSPDKFNQPLLGSTEISWE